MGATSTRYTKDKKETKKIEPRVRTMGGLISRIDEYFDPAELAPLVRDSS